MLPWSVCSDLTDRRSELSKAETNFNSTLSVVLRDLKADLIRRNHPSNVTDLLTPTNIHKLFAQRNKQLNLGRYAPDVIKPTGKVDDQIEVKSSQSKSEESDKKSGRTKYEKRVRRKKMRKKCMSLSKQFSQSGVKAQRRVW
jgi:hypothetical protein